MILISDLLLNVDNFYLYILLIVLIGHFKSLTLF